MSGIDFIPESICRPIVIAYMDDIIVIGLALLYCYTDVKDLLVKRQINPKTDTVSKKIEAERNEKEGDTKDSEKVKDKEEILEEDLYIDIGDDTESSDESDFE